MATSYVAGTLVESINSKFRNTLDLSTIDDSLVKSYSTSLTNGTGANKAQIQWADQRTLLTTAGETLDLRALVGAAFGTALFTKVKYLLIKPITATAGYRLEVGAADANQFCGSLGPLKDATSLAIAGAGGGVKFESPVDGFTVDATHKDLKIYNPSGGSVTYDIIIIGEGSVA